jgi:hypothetical protein
MPDTGPPWNIPYVDPTDLVRDYPQASEDLADAVAAGLSGASVIKQVVQTVKTDAFSTSLTSTQISADIFDVKITPTSATSKVLLLCTINGSVATSTNGWGVLLYKDGNPADFRGDAEGSRTRGVGGQPGADSGGLNPYLTGFTFLDAPDAVVEVTYSVRIMQNSSATRTVFINRSNTDNDAFFGFRGASSLIAIEVAT